MTHLEQLIYEYYDWQGYLVKHNVNVGKRKEGGYEMELDIIAFNPITNHLIHIEPSIDADSWDKREKRFKKKFQKGKEYIISHIFKWLNKDVEIEQYAVLIVHPKNRDKIGGGTIISIDEFVKDIQFKINNEGSMGYKAIPEQYPLLRTIQMVTNGYYKKI